MRSRYLVRFIVCLVVAKATVAAPLVLKINADHVLAAGADRKLGINVNYLMDNDRDWRRDEKRSTADALVETGARWLRFPGGEKSDTYLWSQPSFSRPQPALARTGPTEWPAGDRRFTLEDNSTYRIATLGFDDFIAICRRLGAEPICVVPLDSCYKPAGPGGHAPTKAELLANACAWVKYANLTKGYGVKYWEIGNEGFLPTPNGNPPSAAVYGRDIAEFARAMKAVDPTVKIGANGSELAWWRELLPEAAADIDFLVAHDYPCWEWGRYETYLGWHDTLTPATDRALQAIRELAPKHADRLRIATTEFNAADWSKGSPWPNDNDVGHMIVLVEMMGNYLTNPAVINALLWNTRWIDNPRPRENTLWDAIDAHNQLNASGRALEAWRIARPETMVEISGSDDRVRTFASRAGGDESLTVVALNKSSAPVEVSFESTGSVVAYRPSEIRVLAGKDASDRNPIRIEKSDQVKMSPLVLPAFSVTVVRLDAKPR